MKSVASSFNGFENLNSEAFLQSFRVFISQFQKNISYEPTFHCLRRWSFINIAFGRIKSRIV